MISLTKIFRPVAVAALVLLLPFAPSAMADEPLPGNDGRYERGAYDHLTQVPQDEYARGTVLKVTAREESLGEGTAYEVKTYVIRMNDGSERGSMVTVESNDFDATRQSREFAPGDTVVVVKTWQDDVSASHYLVDNYRLPSLGWMALIFFAVAVAVGRRRGLTSALGLAATVAAVIWFIVPQVAAGRDPLLVCAIAGFAVTALALFVGHGFHARTGVAFAGTAASLLISVGLAVLFVRWGRLFGTGSDDVTFLQGVGYDGLDLRGLLLGGIILGVMGILDDVTTAQASVVEELKAANPAFRFRELFVRGSNVGREHIASLINTLFLAYAGASLPLFLLFSASHGQPLWLVVNSEMVAEEAVRTLVGSLGLILAVPITTLLAAAWYDKREPEHAVAHRH